MLKFFEGKEKYAPLILRYGFGAAFLVAGLDKVLSFSGASGMFGNLFGGVGTVVLVLAIIIEVGGGIALLANKYVKEASLALALLILVAFVKTFAMGAAPNFVASIREILVMNTAPGQTPVQFAYLVGLLSLAFMSESKKA